VIGIHGYISVCLHPYIKWSAQQRGYIYLYAYIHISSDQHSNTDIYICIPTSIYQVISTATRIHISVCLHPYIKWSAQQHGYISVLSSDRGLIGVSIARVEGKFVLLQLAFESIFGRQVCNSAYSYCPAIGIRIDIRIYTRMPVSVYAVLGSASRICIRISSDMGRLQLGGSLKL